MKSENKLYFPANISLKKEYWKGFGNEELKRTLIVTLPTIAMCFILGIFFKLNVIFLIVIFAVVVALTITVVQRMDNYISIFNYAKQFFVFKREQQTFYYKGSVK